MHGVMRRERRERRARRVRERERRASETETERERAREEQTMRGTTNRRSRASKVERRLLWRPEPEACAFRSLSCGANPLKQCHPRLASEIAGTPSLWEALKSGVGWSSTGQPIAANFSISNIIRSRLRSPSFFQLTAHNLLLVVSAGIRESNFM